MKYQNFAIIFVLLILPISIVLSYYIQTQTDTLVLQTTYQTKLNDSTYDAIAAYQMNSLNTQKVSGESVKSYVLASVNTFFTTLATNLGMSSASKQMILPYVPAILFTTYDGYYIYSPTYMAKVATNPDTGVALLTSGKKENVYLKKGQNVEASDDIETDGVTVKWSDTKFTINPDDTNVQYETSYMLKPFIYYSSQYKDNDFNFTVSYSLDNYITLYGKKSNNRDEEPINANVWKVDTSSTAKAVTEEFTKSGYLIDPSKITISGQLVLRLNKATTNVGGQIANTARPEDIGNRGYNAVLDTNRSDNLQKNNERYKIINVSQNMGRPNTTEDYYYINYYDYENGKNYDNSGYYCSRFESNDSKVYASRFQDGDAIIEDTLELEKLKNNREISSSDINENFTGLKVTYNGVEIEDYEAKEYYIKAYYFSKWVQNNLSDVEANSVINIDKNDADKKNSFAYTDFENDSSKIFNIENQEENDPEIEDSLFVKHKQDVIKNSIQYNLNLAISTYNENHNMDIDAGTGYRLPVLKNEDWNNILNNVCMVSFMQGLPCGTTTFNNYAVVKSNNNNTSANLENIYFTEEIGKEQKSNEKYHKIDCSNWKNNTSYDGSTVYEADQSAEFKYDAHKINTKITNIDDETIECFYDDSTNKYYKTYNIVDPDHNKLSRNVDDLTIGEEITNQDDIKTFYSTLPTGNEVKYLYDHQNEGCYDCIISGNYIPAVKLYKGKLYRTYQEDDGSLLIDIREKENDTPNYINLDGTPVMTAKSGNYLIEYSELEKRRKSVYTYLAKIKNSLYKTNDYINR